jgi:hypothetical protein
MLLVTGRSAGALLRARARRAAGRERGARSIESLEWADWSDDSRSRDCVSNGIARRDRGQGLADRWDGGVPGRRLSTGPLSRAAVASPARAEADCRRDEAPRVRRPVSGAGTGLPDRGALKAKPARARRCDRGERAHGLLLVETLAHFGVDATIVGQIAGPRVVRYELQLAPGHEGLEGRALKDDLSYALATTEIRILAPIPGKQAVGVEVPNLSPSIVTLGDIFGRSPGLGEPACRCGSARTSPATPCGPTWRGCRTC